MRCNNAGMFKDEVKQSKVFHKINISIRLNFISFGVEVVNLNVVSRRLK